MLADCRDFFKYHAGGKKDTSLIPKQSVKSGSIEYKSNNGVLNIKTNNAYNFHDPLQLAIAAPPVNKSAIDPLQIEKSWKRGRGADATEGGNEAKKNSLKWNTSVNEASGGSKAELPVQQRPRVDGVVEKAEYKKHVDNFASHISNHDTLESEAKRQRLEKQTSSTSTATTMSVSVPSLPVNEVGEKKKRSESANRFINRFKRELPDKYEDFKILIAKYSKRRITQDQIIQKTADILFAHVTPAEYEDRYSLFKLLSAFISAKHSDYYEALLQQYSPR